MSFPEVIGTDKAQCDNEHALVTYAWSPLTLWECPVCNERLDVEERDEELDERENELDRRCEDMDERENELDRRCEDMDEDYAERKEEFMANIRKEIEEDLKERDDALCEQERIHDKRSVELETKRKECDAKIDELNAREKKVSALVKWKDSL